MFKHNSKRINHKTLSISHYEDLNHISDEPLAELEKQYINISYKTHLNDYTRTKKICENKLTNISRFVNSIPKDKNLGKQLEYMNEEIIQIPQLLIKAEAYFEQAEVIFQDEKMKYQYQFAKGESLLITANEILQKTKNDLDILEAKLNALNIKYYHDHVIESDIASRYNNTEENDYEKITKIKEGVINLGYQDPLEKIEMADTLGLIKKEPDKQFQDILTKQVISIVPGIISDIDLSIIQPAKDDGNDKLQSLESTKHTSLTSNFINDQQDVTKNNLNKDHVAKASQNGLFSSQYKADVKKPHKTGKKIKVAEIMDPVEEITEEQRSKVIDVSAANRKFVYSNTSK